MMNKLILSSVFCLSVLSLAGQTPVKEFDFTSGKFPAGTEPMLSKRCVGKLKTPLFVKSKDKFALNTGGAGQHGLLPQGGGAVYHGRVQRHHLRAGASRH